MKNITVTTMLTNIFAKQAKEIEVKINDCMSLGNHYLFEATVYLDNHDNVIIKKTFEILAANIECSGDTLTFNQITGMMNKSPIAQHIVPLDLYKTLMNLEFVQGGFSLDDISEFVSEIKTNEFQYDIELNGVDFNARHILVINELTSSMFD